MTPEGVGHVIMFRLINSPLSPGWTLFTFHVQTSWQRQNEVEKSQAKKSKPESFRWQQ